MAAIIIPGIFFILFSAGLLFVNPRNLPPLLQIVRKGLVVVTVLAIPIYLGSVVYDKYKQDRRAENEQAQAMEYERSIAETDSLMKLWIIGSWTRKSNGGTLCNSHNEYTFTDKNNFYTNEEVEGTFKIIRGRIILHGNNSNDEVLDFSNPNYNVYLFDTSVSPEVMENRDWTFVKSSEIFQRKDHQIYRTTSN